MGAEGLLLAFCCVLFVPFVFQTVGFFTPMWASNATCDSIGLVYSCCTGDENDTCKNTNGGDELDARSLGLHATSFAVMFLAMFCLCCGICCCDDDGETGLCTSLGGCCTLLFPVAGLFSLIGCIIVATQFSTSELGYSFYLCLTAGCLIILLTIVGCLVVCNNGEKDDRYPARRQSTVCPTNGNDGNNPAHRSSAEYPSHWHEGDNPAHRSSAKYPSHGHESDNPAHRSSAKYPSHGHGSDNAGLRSSAEYPSHGNEGETPAQRFIAEYPSNGYDDDYPAGRSQTVYPCNGYGDDSSIHRSRSISPSGSYGSASRQPSFSRGGASSVVLYSGSDEIAAFEPPQAQYEGQIDTMHAAAVVHEEKPGLGVMFDVLSKFNFKRLVSSFK